MILFAGFRGLPIPLRTADPRAGDFPRPTEGRNGDAEDGVGVFLPPTMLTRDMIVMCVRKINGRWRRTRTRENKVTSFTEIRLRCSRADAAKRHNDGTTDREVLVLTTFDDDGGTICEIILRRRLQRSTHVPLCR